MREKLVKYMPTHGGTVGVDVVQNLTKSLYPEQKFYYINVVILILTYCSNSL